MGVAIRGLVCPSTAVDLRLFRRRSMSCTSLPALRCNTDCAELKAPYTQLPSVVIGNPSLLERKKDNIRTAGGLSKLQVIADFDMTLTKYKVAGKRGQSSHSLLNQGNVEYDLKRQQLFEYYYPLETSSAIPLDEKTKLMEEWWEKTHDLLVRGGLNRKSITQSVANATIEFRDGVTQLFKFLQEKCVPVLIFSAGLSDIIEEVMHQKLHHKFSNVRVVSNRMDFDSDGNLIGFKGKTIHVLNKNEHAVGMATPGPTADGYSATKENYIASLKERKNVLLLGDHLGDLGMSDGLEYENRISVGFLNENVDDWLDVYKEEYDIVLIVLTEIAPVYLPPRVFEYCSHNVHVAHISD